MFPLQKIVPRHSNRVATEAWRLTLKKTQQIIMAIASLRCLFPFRQKEQKEKKKWKTSSELSWAQNWWQSRLSDLANGSTVRLKLSLCCVSFCFFCFTYSFFHRLATLLGIKLHLTQPTRRAGATYKSCEAQRVRYDYERLARGRTQSRWLGQGQLPVFAWRTVCVLSKICSCNMVLQVGGASFLASAVPLANCNFNGLQEVKLKLQWSILLSFPQSLSQFPFFLSLFTWRMRNKNARAVNALWVASNCSLDLSTLTFAWKSFLFELGLKSKAQKLIKAWETNLVLIWQGAKLMIILFKVEFISYQSSLKLDILFKFSCDDWIKLKSHSYWF